MIPDPNATQVANSTQDFGKQAAAQATAMAVMGKTDERIRGFKYWLTTHDVTFRLSVASTTGHPSTTSRSHSTTQPSIRSRSSGKTIPCPLKLRTSSAIYTKIRSFNYRPSRPSPLDGARSRC